MTTTLARPSEPVLEDARGLKCPLPALRTRRALLRLDVGASLTVLADDPMATIDIPHLVFELGDELVETAQEVAFLRFVIRRRGAGPASGKGDQTPAIAADHGPVGMSLPTKTGGPEG
jgi:tRNA 2-thiouridine synthesizing protein A